VLYAHSQLLCSLLILNCQPWESTIPVRRIHSDRLLFVGGRRCFFITVS